MSVRRKIGKYEVLEKIAQGGMGIVYKARDPRLGRIVAIKTLHARSGDGPAVHAQFVGEARSAGALAHKNIITIYEMDGDAEQSYIVMEFLEGEDLHSLIARRTLLPLEQKLRILTETCEGMAYAHGMGLIHRDIKPGNIFITQSGQVKILDFGLARPPAQDATWSDAPTGTLCYMSPEQVRGEAADHRSDIFSFGVVAYELLVCQHPFRSESEYGSAFKITQVEPRPLESIEPSIPIELSSIVFCALEKESLKRYQQAKEVLEELKSVKSLLYERKRALRDEARQLVAELERVVRENGGLIADLSSRAASLKTFAPELFESSLPPESGQLSAWTRELQPDYFRLLHMRDRARSELEGAVVLAEKRKKTAYLLREAEDLRNTGQLSSARAIVEWILREDPAHAPATALHREISAQRPRD